MCKFVNVFCFSFVRIYVLYALCCEKYVCKSVPFKKK